MSGLFGQATECAYKLSSEQQYALKKAVLEYAYSDAFQKQAGLYRNEKVRKIFFGLLESAEYCGSNAGGAAGYLVFDSESAKRKQLRFALQIKDGAGNLFGLLGGEVAMKHELLHFVREAEALHKRGVSLFQSEKNNSPFFCKICLMLREETFVWMRTIK